MNCRHCNNPLTHEFLDLGFAPPSNAYLGDEDLGRPEIYYPLKLLVCERCWLVQTEDYASADELFSKEYAYFSSTSLSWLEHARQYSHNVINRLELDHQSLVIEVASNDGYLLRNFVEAGIPCLGIEPTDSTAAAAENIGIPVLREFFGATLAEALLSQGKQADLIVGNNVYAHVPDINDFTRGLKLALKPGGTITLEFPHLQNLIDYCQFDTAYHEHFSYLSLHAVCQIFSSSGLRIFDVDQLATHGGSLRVYGCHEEDMRATESSIGNLLAGETEFGLNDMDTYIEFQQSVDSVKNRLLDFLIQHKTKGTKIMGYGAAAKGNTLLNYAGVKPDLLPVIADAAVSKQGKYMPGSHIPIVNPEEIRARKPDLILILPWNIRAEVVSQLEYIRDWGGRFAVAVPGLEEFE